MTYSTLDASAARFLRYLQRGGAKSYSLTFNAAGHARATWYDSGAEPPAPPAGTNVYFGVNPCTAIPSTNAAGKPMPPSAVRGRVEYIAALNCLYADFDAKDLRGSLDTTLAHVRSLALQPTIVIASGGGYHCYWLLVDPFVLDTDETRGRAVDVQARWVTFVRGDKAAKDLARVLRVPGTLNYKYTPAQPVAFVEQDYSRLYTLDELQATLPAVAPRTARQQKPAAPACHTDSLEPGLAQPSIDWMAVSKAAAALARLRAERRDEYASWLHVGMALRELGTIGYTMWDQWSMDSPKYSVGACAGKWPTFRIGTPGGTDITLASLYRWADEDAEPIADSTLDENERRQLQAYKARDVQTQKILAMDAPLAAKAVWVGMLPPVEAASILVENKDGHSGSVSVNYGNFAAILKTSKTSVGNYVELGDKAGLWRKDPELVETKAGYDMLAMRLDLQPAFFNPELAQPIEHKPRGGARPGAGRKPKCADCPPGTHVIKKTTVTYICEGCGQPLDAEPPHYEVMPLDEPPAATEFKHETGMPLATVSTIAAEIKHETEGEPFVYPVSCLKKPLDVSDPSRLPGVRSGMIAPDDQWFDYLRATQPKGMAP